LKEFLDSRYLKPHKISALLDNFFFIVSKGGPKEKCQNYWFLIFLPLVLLGNYKKKLSK
jgi:hypothetical protein